MSNLIGALLTEVVLYTLKETNSKSRDGLEKLLSNKSFIKEGDQSTLIRRSGLSRLKVSRFFDDLNDLCKKVEFSNGDTVSLIVPTILRGKHLFGQNLPQPFIKRYKFIFDKNSNSFTNFFEKRDMILHMLGIRKK